MNNTSTVVFRILFFISLLTSIPATAQANILILWDGEQQPTPYSVFNGSSHDIYAIVFPHNSASDAYTDNGWTAQIVTRTEWENGSFTFTDPNGWAPPIPSSIDWDIAFPAPFPEGHDQVVAYWLGAGISSPILAGTVLYGAFWTDVIPDGEWPGIGLDVNGDIIRSDVSAVPLPLPAALFLTGIACLLINIRTGNNIRCSSSE